MVDTCVIMFEMAESRGLPEATVSDLEHTFAERCLVPGDDAYDESISLWNSAAQRYPAVVVRCRNATDVVDALEVINAHDAPFSVKCGGHMTTGHAVVDDGVVLDLSPMDAVEVDTDEATVRVGGGAIWEDVNEVALEHGLIPPGIPETAGVGGFTLGGGMGVTGRLTGLAVDNLRTVEVVTASGEVVTASESENADLFWGLRGGGGNVGIVTAFEFDCVEAPRECLVANVLYPIDDAASYFAYFDEIAPTMHEATFPTASLITVPPIPDLPEDLHGELAVAGYAMGVVTDDAVETSLEEFADFGEPHVAMVYPADYTELYAPFHVPPGHRHHWESFYLHELGDDFIEAMLDETLPMPTPETAVSIYGLGGAINDVDSGATAYAHRDAPFALHLVTHWTDEADDDACIDWTRTSHAALRDFGTGGEYVNNQTDTDRERIRAAYGENYDRIAEVKAKWDPENRLTSTQHVETD